MSLSASLVQNQNNMPKINKTKKIPIRLEKAGWGFWLCDHIAAVALLADTPLARQRNHHSVLP